MAISLLQRMVNINGVTATRQSGELPADLLQVAHEPGRRTVLTFG